MVKWAGKLLRDYQQFLKDHKLSTGSPKDIKDEMKVLLGGIENLVDGFQQQTTEHWYYFMQQLSQFWVPEEHMARPQVSIVNLELDKEDIPYHKDHTVAIAPFTPFENRTKETIGYTSDRQFFSHPFLYLEGTQFSYSHECRWKLIYRNEELPEKFEPLNLYVSWEKNQNQVYDILWFLKHSKSQFPEVGLQFPLYSFAYPEHDVPHTYRHSLNNLMPYPAALDFFVELYGLEKKHFKWDEEDKLWKSEILWKSEEVKLKDFQQIPKGIFKLHCLPLYHWIKKDLKTVKRRERLRLLGLDPTAIIWLKVSSHTELMPLPYYLSHSLDKRLTGYIKLKENYVEVEATPVTSVEEKDEPYPINIEVLLTQNLKEKLPRYKGLKLDIIDKIESEKLAPRFLQKPETMEEEQHKETILKDHYYFWHKWRMSLRQWDESTLKSLFENYFKHLSIENVQEVSIKPVTMRFLPGKGVFPVLAIGFSVPATNGKLWFALKRFYDYLKERSPICLIPYLEIEGKDKTIPIFSVDI